MMDEQIGDLRPLRPEDASEWLRLRLEALRGDPEAFSASLEEYESLSLDEVKTRLWSGSEAFVVGAFDGSQRLNGVAGFFRERGAKTRHKGRVWGVYVSPVAREKGIGKALMQSLLEHAARIDGVEQILISVATTQEAARKLYRSLGFEPFGREPRALKIGGKLIDEEYMVLQLDRTEAD
ncbi:MAG TPA: GNAT family N-acetyltransferase [Candidatus Solibacter sp.]|nr:GNAT family N-acetyltransferase [Candidatus Solibacter sp.]